MEVLRSSSPLRSLFGEALRFVLVGGLGFLINLGIVIALTEGIHLWYFYSYLVGAVVNITFNFFLNSFVTFRNHGRTDMGRAYASTLVLYGAVGLVNAGIVFTLTSIIGIYYVASVIIATACTLTLTFFGSKRYIFTKRNAISSNPPTQ